MRMSKQSQNFHFWVDCPFKGIISTKILIKEVYGQNDMQLNK